MMVVVVRCTESTGGVVISAAGRYQLAGITGNCYRSAVLVTGCVTESRVESADRLDSRRHPTSCCTGFLRGTQGPCIG